MTTPYASVFVLLSLVAVHPAAAAPAAATLVAPTGDVVGTTIAFSWQSVPESTWYLFWLGKGNPPNTFVMQQWYTAEQAGCANGGTCTISLTPPINGGGHTWFIQTWGAGALGPWSIGKVFVLKDPMPNWSSLLPADRRFTLVLREEAVLDNETGLVWDRTPESASYTWAQAVFRCSSIRRANRYGWRLPTVAELQSVFDGGSANPALPSGHPFTFPSFAPVDSWLWSQTFAPDTRRRMVVSSYEGNGTDAYDYDTAHVWCVRAPSTF